MRQLSRPCHQQDLGRARYSIDIKSDSVPRFGTAMKSYLALKHHANNTGWTAKVQLVVSLSRVAFCLRLVAFLLVSHVCMSYSHWHVVLSWQQKDICWQKSLHFCPKPSIVLRNGMKETCDELGVKILAYSPLALGVLPEFGEVSIPQIKRSFNCLKRSFSQGVCFSNRNQKVGQQTGAAHLEKSPRCFDREMDPKHSTLRPKGCHFW